MNQPSPEWEAALARARRDYAADVRRYRAGWPWLVISAIQRMRFLARLVVKP